MDVSTLDAIDVHTHVHRSVTAATPEAGQALEAMAAYFKTDAAAYTVDELAQYYRDRNMAAVTFTVDVKDRPVRVSSEEVAERAAANADVIIPFASVDPARGAEGAPGQQGADTAESDRVQAGEPASGPGRPRSGSLDKNIRKL